MAGILAAIYWGEFLPVPWTIISLFVLLAGYLLSIKVFAGFFLSRNKLIALVAFSIIFLSGYLSSICSDHTRNIKHFSHEAEKITYYVAVVQKPAEKRAKANRYEVALESYKVEHEWKDGVGKFHLYLNKQLKYGDKLLIKGQPAKVSPPYNPEEFDYQRFLSFRNIYHQHFIRAGEVWVIGNDEPNILLGFAFQVRTYAAAQLAHFVKAPRESGIAQALVLGVKDSLDNSVKNAYAASGAMHILAVSGLHVGIIYGLLLLLFGKLQQTRSGNWMLACICLLILWCYAMVTGFSPSVLRAVTMFSFVTLAKATRRSTNIYNTLAASALCLLLFDPYLVMAVGFQLSFLAVFGIVYLQPKLYKIFIPNTIFMDKVWSITTVALAAQLATFPLGMFYFNQFPTFFFISNLVVIPGALIILILGLAVIALGFLEHVAEWVGQMLEWCIYGVNELVFAMEALPNAQITGIHLTVMETWLIFGVITFFLIFLNRKDYYYGKLALGLAIIFSCYRIFDLYHQPEKITIYRINKFTAVDFIANGNSFIYIDEALKLEEVAYQVAPNHLASNIRNVSRQVPVMQAIEGIKIACWGNKRIVILDENIDEKLKLQDPVAVDYVLVCRKFNRSMRWIIKNFSFEKIILDGSLSWYRANSIKRELDALEKLYYSVYHNGAYEIKI